MKDLDVSIDFMDFPSGHTCYGENTSPKISLQGLDASSVAIMVFNPSIREVLSYCAWLIWDLPAVPVIPAGIPHGKIVKTPVSALQGTNDAGQIGWSGPCPLPGHTHRYLFRVYGLDDFLDIPAGSRKGELRAAMHGHVIQYGETEAIATGISGREGTS
jgi:Raf kinase inhibitor-like YbhB/YbcL family protein